jgi:hypothetical protein
MPHFICSFISRMAFGMFPLWGYYEYCYSDHLRPSFCFCSSWYPRSMVVQSYANSMSNLLRSSRLFSKELHHFVFPPTMYEGSNFSTFLPKLFSAFLLSSNHPSGSEESLPVFLVYISPVTNSVELLFVCLLTICIFSLENYLFRLFVHF